MSPLYLLYCSEKSIRIVRELYVLLSVKKEFSKLHSSCTGILGFIRMLVTFMKSNFIKVQHYTIFETEGIIVLLLNLIPTLSQLLLIYILKSDE